jgi:hypothetical protein
MIEAIILISPPQTLHVETSIPKTRLKSLDQDPLSIFFSSFFSSFSFLISARVLPGIIPRLSLEFGAKTPQNLTRWRLGRGTREHSFSISSRGDRRTWVIPFFHAFLSSYLAHTFAADRGASDIADELLQMIPTMSGDSHCSVKTESVHSRTEARFTSWKLFLVAKA